ncbi:MAG TPA: hypothetical protein DHV14_08905 [Micrococcales bacterium]|uniref:DUF6880 family protein n=1 Tax=Miniimonas arenae TaxID=676201 RepID=UPI000EDC5CE7|nr:DUF6880 family protein [Miniimonas arenae]HCX85237.1 hypothetical protein [Micrococcales bacterium]
MQLTPLADAVLPLIRTDSRELWRWSNANRHGAQMLDGVAILELAVAEPEALPSTYRVVVPTPRETYQVAHKALASAIRIIARADDSSGIIGDAVRGLIALHPVAAAAAEMPPAKLAEWMWQFHFDDDVDYFELDPVAYAPALGAKGIARLREHVEELRAQVAAQPAREHGHSHEAFLLSWFDQRLAVLDRDVDAIVRTHLRDGKVAAWFTATAKALAEIERYDLAIDWACQAMEFDLGHQARQGGDYWWQLLGEHQPDSLADAAWTMLRRWPGSDTAARLEETVGPKAREEIVAILQARPSALVHFLVGVGEVQGAWDAAHRLGLDDRLAWDRLASAYESIDPGAAIEVHLDGVAADLVTASTRAYRPAARRLAQLREVAVNAGPEAVATVDSAIADLRETYRRRPSMLAAFDGAGLP